MAVRIETPEQFQTALGAFVLLWRARPEKGSDDARTMLEYARALDAYTGPETPDAEPVT